MGQHYLGKAFPNYAHPRWSINVVTRTPSVVLLALLAISCGGDSTRPVPVAAVTLSQTTVQLSLGASVTLVATPTDDDGNALTDRSVTWSTNNGSVATVSTSGLVTAVGAGSATISARSENVSADAQITVSAPVATVTLDRTTVQLAVGDSTQLVATTRDAQNHILTGRTVTWGSTVGSVATVSSTGWVKGLTTGGTTITATSETVTAQAQVIVGTAPVLSAITPALLTPGATAVITGTDFSITANDNIVTIDGVQSAVIGATGTELTVLVPPATQLPCTATHNATVEVAVGGVSGSLAHPLQVASQRAMAPGDVLSFATATLARCNELAQTGGRYFVAVTRPDNAIVSTSAFRFAGEGSTVLSASVLGTLANPTSSFSAASSVRASFGSRSISLDARRAAASQHYRILEQNRALGSRPGVLTRRSSGSRASLSRSRVSLALTTVGDTSTLKIPNTNLASFCSSAPISVRARTVYSGTKAVVLEDVAAPLAGTMDAYYQAIGQEFDNVMYPIVKNNFGDPLAFDSELDDNGKLIMLFSKQVNDFGGVLGFVTACDFLDTLAIPSATASNQAEIFYAIAPTTAGGGFDNSSATLTADEWRWQVRGTVIHEAKHLAMYAERFANAGTTVILEESWLEEGMAVHSEELYARTFSGATWKGNSSYGNQSAPNHLWCELRPNITPCLDRPLLILQGFAFLHDYLSDIENRSLVGRVPTDPSDNSFYGSAWAFVRWMIDSYAADEGAMLRAITTEPALTGIANLSARSGVAYEDMLPRFHYAIRYDDAPGLTPTAPWQHIQSWNIPAVFAGMNVDLGFAADYLLDHAVTFGTFGFDIDLLRGGTASHFELTGTQTAKQLLVLEAQNGGAPPTPLRMTVFRVE